MKLYSERSINKKMQNNFFRGILLFAAIITAALFLRIFIPVWEDEQQKGMSDSRDITGSISLAVDSWIGYFPLRSPEMARSMRKDGIRLDIQDDQGDYSARMDRLAKGEINAAVATVDSYILNAAAHKYPGVIVMVLDESKGGDAIVTRDDVAKNLDDLKQKEVTVAFTPNSPSHHLLKAVVSHFNVPNLLPDASRRIETQGSADALKQLLNKQADVAVLWEPDVTRAVSQQGIHKVMGTEETANLIVDILIINRDFARDRVDMVHRLMMNYFQTLKFYRENPEQLKKHVQDETKASAAEAQSMLNGVRWVTLMENCEQWFGISSKGAFSDERIISVIDSTLAILLDHNDFTSNPLPEKDPYRITFNGFLDTLYRNNLSGFISGMDGDAQPDSLSHPFEELPPEKWDTLQDVGTLKIEPIVFQQGTSNLSLPGKQALDKLVSHLKHYPTFRVWIKGHTSTEGDEDINVELSKKRAESAARYLHVTYNIDPHRIRTEGFGGQQPLPQKPNESLRAWRYRLPRVEITLVREVF